MDAKFISRALDKVACVVSELASGAASKKVKLERIILRNDKVMIFC